MVIPGWRFASVEAELDALHPAEVRRECRLFADSMMNAGGLGSPYQITNSLLFRGAQYLSLAPAVAGNCKVGTFRTCARRGTLGGYNTLIHARVDASNQAHIYWYNDQLNVFLQIAGSNYSWTTAPLYRDPTAWLDDIVVGWDTTTQALSCSINGQAVVWSSSATLPLNADLSFGAAAPHTIGALWSGSAYSAHMDGQMAEPVLVIGTKLPPTTFGETDPITGNWRPKSPAISSWGNNGCYLGKPWNAADLGNDYSGQNNDWTPTGFVSTDVVSDSPTNVYATLNPLSGSVGSGASMSGGNLTIGGTSVTGHGSLPELSQGKWYWEVKVDSQYYQYPNIGVWSSAAGSRRFGANSTGNANGAGFIAIEGGNTLSAGLQYGETSYQTTTAAPWNTVYTVGDVIGIALDLTNGKIWFRKNGTWLQGDPVAGTSPAATFNPALYTYTPAVFNYSSSVTFNFGQRAFAASAPTGFKALCTSNLPAPSAAAKQPWKYYHQSLVVHNGTSSTFTLGWNPDPANGGAHTLFRVKPITAGSWNYFDTKRGLDKVLWETTSAEETVSKISAAASGVCSLLSGYAAGTYLVEAWRVAPEAGFDIVLDTGTGVARTVAHGNGSTPAMIVRKCRDATNPWVIGHASAGWSGQFNLNATAWASNSGSFNSTSPTATEFTVGADSSVNQSAKNFVTYVWSPVPGFSAFGKWTNNGSIDGPFISLPFVAGGFTAKTNSASDWYHTTTEINLGNPAVNYLALNTNAAQGTSGHDLDIDAAGVKLRTINDPNYSTSTTYYATWAKAPLGASNTTPATAR